MPDGWLSKNERIRKAELGAKGHWRSLGTVGTRQLSVLYSGTLCLVFPSIDEGFGLPPMEALRHRTPLVLSDIPTHREIYKEGVLFCDLRDVWSLIDSIRSIQTRVDLRSQLGDSGYAYSLHFDWQNTVDQTVSAYLKLS